MLRSPAGSAKPTGYAPPSQNSTVCTFGTSLHSPPPRSSFADALIYVTVPFAPFDSRGAAECAFDRDSVTYLARLLRHPRSAPQDPSPMAYTVGPTEAMGLGIFAQRPLDIGDLILVERPLLVFPSTALQNKDLLETLLRKAYKRMSKENQHSLAKLANAYENRTPSLSGIFLTNAIELGDMDLNDYDRTYAGVFQELSRVNHSCRPNCAISFHPASLALELRATTPIAKGEQIFLSYCCPTSPTAERQAALSRYNFCCTCYSCQPTPSHPSNDSIRVSIPGCYKLLNGPLPSPNAEAKDSEKARSGRPSMLQLRQEILPVMLREMEQEGLQGTRDYYKTLNRYSLVCAPLILDLEKAGEVARISKTVAQLEMAHEGSSRFNTAFSHYLYKLS